MKRLTFSLLGAIMLSIMYNAQVSTSENWQTAGTSSFNEVRVVCIPHKLALHGADKNMRDIGVNQKIEVTESREQWACYIKYYNNPSKPVYARQECGSRRRFAPGQFDHVYSALSQFACGIRFIEPDKIADKVKNPLNYAVKMNNLTEALDYIKSGKLPQRYHPVLEQDIITEYE